MTVQKKENYLNNRDMLIEIHKSKVSFSYFVDPRFNYYDYISYDINDFERPEVIEQAKAKHADRVNYLIFKEALKTNKDQKISRKDVIQISPDDVDESDLVFRYMTEEHIPVKTTRRKINSDENSVAVRLNFPPFKHYRKDPTEYSISTVETISGTTLYEVGRSHWNVNGFSISHGQMTDTLAKMLMMLVNRYSQRGNWRGYTYVDEMKGQALLQLSSMALSFNEAKSENPFAYFTQTISNSFTKIFNTEKMHQNIRDDLLIESGQNPSYTRMLDNDYSGEERRNSNGWDYE